MNMPLKHLFLFVAVALTGGLAQPAGTISLPHSSPHSGYAVEIEEFKSGQEVVKQIFLESV